MTRKIAEHPIKKTLWEAILSFPSSREEQKFLFREVDDIEAATKEAIALAESSPAVRMVGARVVKVQRIAHLWN